MNRRSLGVIAALTLTLAGVSACGSGDGTAGASDSASATVSGSAAPPVTTTVVPSVTATVAPYLTAVPSGVSLTAPGTALKLDDHAVIAWHPKVDQTAVLDVQITRIERTTYDKSFQGWKVNSTQAATTPYFARAVVTNVSDTDLGGVQVPILAEQDSGTLVAAQPFQERVFQPCHPYVTPTKFEPGAHLDMCFVFAISPGQDLKAITFAPSDESNADLALITWTGHVSTKVQPPAVKKSAKGDKADKGDKSDKKKSTKP